MASSSASSLYLSKCSFTVVDEFRRSKRRITRNRPSRSMVYKDSQASLCATLMETSSIEILQLNSTDVGDAVFLISGNYCGALSANALAKGNGGNKSLRGAAKVADALKQNRSIAIINMVRSDHLLLPAFCANGAKALSEILKFHGSVKTLKHGLVPDSFRVLNMLQTC
ncbi:unnamed protein product [Cochlearia groenlandica]